MTPLNVYILWLKSLRLHESRYVLNIYSYMCTYVLEGCTSTKKWLTKHFVYFQKLSSSNLFHFKISIAYFKTFQNIQYLGTLFSFLRWHWSFEQLHLCSQYYLNKYQGHRWSQLFAKIKKIIFFDQTTSSAKLLYKVISLV